MFCTKCGKELNEGTKFCVSCGAPVTNAAANDIQNQNNQYSETPARAVQEYTIPRERKEKNPTALIITLSAVVAVLVIITVILLFNRPSTGGIGTAESRAELVVDTYPEETEDTSYILSGRVTSTGEDAVLTVNGNEVLSISKGDKDISWSTELWLSKGLNTFTVTLTTADGKEENQLVEIEYSPGLLYPAGTILVKSDPAGIFVRPTPAITKEYILYLPYYDYSTQLVCQGEEYVDGEGFTWCKVQIPEGKYGWVRSDIIKSLY